MTRTAVRVRQMGDRPALGPYFMTSSKIFSRKALHSVKK